MNINSDTLREQENLASVSELVFTTKHTKNDIKWKIGG